MHAITCAHASTGTTSMMRALCATSAYDTYCLEHWNEEHEITKILNLIVIIFL